MPIQPLLLAMMLGAQAEAEPPPLVEKRVYRIVQEYDRFRDATVLKLDYGQVWKDDDNRLEMTVYAFFPGKTRLAGRRVNLNFVNDGKDGWHYLSFRPLDVLIDGGRLAFDVEHSGDVEKGYVLEHMWARITAAQFKRFAEAKSLEFRLGNDEFKFGPEEIDAFREFLALVEDPARKISDPKAKAKLVKATAEREALHDNEAIALYQSVVDGSPGTIEADQAVKAIVELSEPTRRDARRKQRLAADAAEAEQDRKFQKAAEDRAFAAKLERDYEIAHALEKYNPKQSYRNYMDIVERARNAGMDAPAVQSAQERMKALKAYKPK